MALALTKTLITTSTFNTACLAIWYLHFQCNLKIKCYMYTYMARVVCTDIRASCAEIEAYVIVSV